MNENTPLLLYFAFVIVDILLSSIIIMYAANFSHADNSSFLNTLKVTTIGIIILAIIHYVLPGAIIGMVAALIVLFIIGSALGVPGDMFLVFLIATFAIRWLVTALIILLLASFVG